MRKKTLIASLVLACVLAIGVVACSPANKADNSGTTDNTPASTDTTPTATDPEPAAETASIGVSGGPLTMDAYFDLRERLDRASLVTAKYGDSDPHDSVHGTALECISCHVSELGGGELQENWSCISCHVWPRDLQSDMRDVTGE